MSWSKFNLKFKFKKSISKIKIENVLKFPFFKNLKCKFKKNS